MKYTGISFELSGRFAFFKNPDANINDKYLTYSTIHKVASLGIFGAILGLGGYNQMKSGESLPDFYKELQNLKVSIEIDNENAYISKKIQTFNNSTGFASFEDGGNLITREQWLENPKWNISVLTDRQYYVDNNIAINLDMVKKLEDMMLNNKGVFVPYLGKNDHPASIKNVMPIDIDELLLNEGDRVNCLCLVSTEDFSTASAKRASANSLTGKQFKLSEYLPIGLNKDTSLYELSKLMITNKTLVARKSIVVYKDKNDKIYNFM